MSPFFEDRVKTPKTDRDVVPRLVTLAGEIASSKIVDFLLYGTENRRRTC